MGSENRVDEEKKTIKGSVLSISGNKELVLVNGRNYYILRGRKDHEGDVISFLEKDSLPMPSYMFAIAAMSDPDLDSTLDQIKERWFGDFGKK